MACLPARVHGWVYTCRWSWWPRPGYIVYPLRREWGDLQVPGLLWSRSVLHELHCRKSCVPPTSSITCEFPSDYVLVSHLFLCVKLQHWNDTFFKDTSLQELGQQVNLGHMGCPCPQPLAEIRSFTVVNLSGVHSINLCYCGCQGAPECRIQLLCQGWFPVSMKLPETAFTFDFLNTFHLVNLHSKTALYNFWLAILHKTNNPSTRDTKVNIVIVT